MRVLYNAYTLNLHRPHGLLRGRSAKTADADKQAGNRTIGWLNCGLYAVILLECEIAASSIDYSIEPDMRLCQKVHFALSRLRVSTRDAPRAGNKVLDRSTLSTMTPKVEAAAHGLITGAVFPPRVYSRRHIDCGSMLLQEQQSSPNCRKLR